MDKILNDEERKKNKKIAPLYEGHANDFKVIAEGYTSFETEKKWLDTIRGVIGEELYDKGIEKAKIKYKIKD